MRRWVLRDLGRIGTSYWAESVSTSNLAGGVWWWGEGALRRVVLDICSAEKDYRKTYITLGIYILRPLLAPPFPSLQPAQRVT